MVEKMEMIIGGMAQGKRALAEGMHQDIIWICGKTASEEELLHAGGILDFQDYIKKELQAGREVSDLAGKLIRNNPDVVIVSQEVGYGVVPMDAFERKYRESVGRVCTELAAFSRRVIRVVCGIGTVIKDA